MKAYFLRLRASRAWPFAIAAVISYEAPFEFTGQLLKVTVDMHDDQKLDGEGVGAAEMARQ
jgi:hypothetical protein